MRILILCIIFPSLITSPSSQNITTISQAFFVEDFATSIITQLEGEVEMVYWKKDEVVVETTIQNLAISSSEYGVVYAVQKGNFELDCSFEENVNTLLLKPKKINNTIYQRGHQQKTKQTYKIYIPMRLQCSIQ